MDRPARATPVTLTTFCDEPGMDTSWTRSAAPRVAASRLSTCATCAARARDDPDSRGSRLGRGPLDPARAWTGDRLSERVRRGATSNHPRVAPRATGNRPSVSAMYATSPLSTYRRSSGARPRRRRPGGRTAPLPPAPPPGARRGIQIFDPTGRIGPFRRGRSSAPSSARREPTTRPETSRIDFDSAELERSEARSGPPRPAVERRAGRDVGDDEDAHLREEVEAEVVVGVAEDRLLDEEHRDARLLDLLAEPARGAAVAPARAAGRGAPARRPRTCFRSSRRRRSMAA